MVYRRRFSHGRTPGGFHRFENANKHSVFGFGEGDYIRLRDEFGNTWRGSAVREDDNTIRYRFRDANGRTITGICDDYGVILRDDKGNTWRGFVD
ncbi:MAG: hypothetical protein HYZ57_18660 [Acidobacteria bacterium]|nr:hypothetical protein [Acidobacteriota bacterium]MBI3281851.1 hypothetical protein [Acidobacteriota bacterium]